MIRRLEQLVLSRVRRLPCLFSQHGNLLAGEEFEVFDHAEGVIPDIPTSPFRE
jgi:hypothetical protein